MHDATRREYVLDCAMNEGRIAAASRADWAQRYSADPATTEATLARLTPVPLGAGVLGYADPVDQTLAAGRAMLRGSRRRQTHASAAASAAASAPAEPYPTTVVAEADLGPETIEAWTRELFPETRTGTSAREGHITTDAKYPRGGMAA